MLKFISFGSGSSGNCYLLATPTDALLIDIGVGLRTLKKSFRDYGCSFSQVHHVLITHDHADHIKSVGSFSHEYGVPVYATREVHEGINRNYCVAKKLAPGLTCLVEKGRQQQIGEFLVTPFEVPHDSTDNVGYLIEVAGDPQFLKERILSHRGHLNNRECGIALAENMSEHLRHVWLCHLSEENNHPELARKTVESVLRSYGIVVDADVQLEVLKRVTPMGPYELGVKSEE